MGIWRSSRTAMILAVSGAVIFGTSIMAQASPASAGHAVKRSLTHKMSVKYHNSWKFKSRSLRRCAKIQTHGTLKYTAVVHPNPKDPPPTIEFKDIRITDPVITATVRWLKSNGDCGSLKRVSKLTLGQHWAGYACNFNPGLSVSFPWGVSVSAWPSCGSRRQAGYTTTYTKDATFYKQSNSGSPTHFGNVTINQSQTAPSFGVYASTVVFEGSKSDSFGAGNGSSAKKAGLRKP